MGGWANGPRKNPSNFGRNPDKRADPGTVISGENWVLAEVCPREYSPVGNVQSESFDVLFFYFFFYRQKNKDFVPFRLIEKEISFG